MKQSMTGGQRLGHLLAIGTISVWGLTFINSTIVLRSISPVQLLVARMVIGILALTVISPKRLKLQRRAHELYFMAIGFFSVSLYFVLENTALTYTSSSNCAVIVSTAPFFIAIFASLFLKEEKLSPLFFVGFLLAIAGLGMVSFAGQKLQLNPLGDLLSLLTAVTWAIGTMFMRKLEKFNYPIILVTRRMFVYGVLFALPMMLFLPTKGSFADLLKPEVLFNVLFLGVVASALCYITWMVAMKRIGVVRSGVYIYMIPVVTMVAAALILHDRIHPLSIGGALMTMAGLFVSQWKKRSAAQAEVPAETPMAVAPAEEPLQAHAEETTLLGG